MNKDRAITGAGYFLAGALFLVLGEFHGYERGYYNGYDRAKRESAGRLSRMRPVDEQEADRNAETDRLRSEMNQRWKAGDE